MGLISLIFLPLFWVLWLQIRVDIVRNRFHPWGVCVMSCIFVFAYLSARSLLDYLVQRIRSHTLLKIQHARLVKDSYFQLFLHVVKIFREPFFEAKIIWVFTWDYLFNFNRRFLLFDKFLGGRINILSLFGNQVTYRVLVLLSFWIAIIMLESLKGIWAEEVSVLGLIHFLELKKNMFV